MIIQVTDLSTSCTVVTFGIKVSCITSVDGIKLWLWTWLVNLVTILLVICKLRWCYWLWWLIMSLVCLNPSIVTAKQSFIVSQIASCPVVLLYWVLVDSINKSFVSAGNCWLRFIFTLYCIICFGYKIRCKKSFVSAFQQTSSQSLTWQTPKNVCWGGWKTDY